MPMRKLLISMSLPLMLSFLIQSLYNIVDSIFVSRIGENALTATSLAFPVQMLMIALSVGTSVGLNTLLSRRVGQKREKDACNAATTGLLLMLFTSALFTLFGILGVGHYAEMMTGDAGIAELCFRYLRVCTLLCQGIFLETYGQRLLQSVGETGLSMVSLVIGSVVNLILDPILIFGLFGAPALGITGAAIATVIGQWSAAAAALMLNRYKNPLIHLSFREYHFERADIRDIYKVGLPTIIMQAIGSVMLFSVNKVLIASSATAVAFFGVYYKLQGFLMMPVNGLGQATIPIVGFNFGAKNFHRIKEAWRLTIPAGLIFSAAAAVLFLLFAKPLLLLFSAGDELLSIGVPALRIIAITFPFATVTMLCGYFATGLGNAVINMVGGLLRQLLLLVPFLVLFMYFFGLEGAWYAFWVAEPVAFLFSFLLTKRTIGKVTAIEKKGE